MKVSSFFPFANLFTILLILICFTACKNKKTKPVFDLNSPGSKVIATYTDSLPQIVYYYKTDEQGKTTDEKIGEAYYYENKQEYVGGGLKDGQREGKWYAFFRDGSVQTEAFYIDGKEHGPYNVYHENGKPMFKWHYDHGVCDGTWYWYDENGNVTKKMKTDKNVITCGYCEKCLKIRSQKSEDRSQKSE
jgi:antitoxin component YwqK of YwqJK toxin-antitoxin module